MTTPYALSERDFADRLNVSVRTFRKLMREGQIPAPLNVAAKPAAFVWLQGTVDEFISGNYRGAMAQLAPAVHSATRMARPMHSVSQPDLARVVRNSMPQTRAPAPPPTTPPLPFPQTKFVEFHIIYNVETGEAQILTSKPR